MAAGQSGEAQLVAWLAGQQRRRPPVVLGIGDDMAIVSAGEAQVLFSSDMLLDGVHFDSRIHALELIGRKALGAGLSDCAAMAVSPLAATVSLALPWGWTLAQSRRLYAGMEELGDVFQCPIVGGDTTGWDQRLAIDVAILGIAPKGGRAIRRDGARPGDQLWVTGKLGGSLSGRHLTFTPRVNEARRLAEACGEALHAMMDLSDGLSLDLFRMCRASGIGALLSEEALREVIHADAVSAAARDGRPALDHALSDGEDFELLAAVAPGCPRGIPGVELFAIGGVTASGFQLQMSDGSRRDLEPKGFEHLP